MQPERKRRPEWDVLSSHGDVLVCLGRDPYLRLAEVAARVNLTGRAVQKIILDLEKYGALERVKEGRRNRYVVHLDLPVRRPQYQGHLIVDTLGPLIFNGSGLGVVAVGSGRDG